VSAEDRLHIHDGDADTAAIADLERTRRDLLRRGLTAGGLALAAGAVPTLLRARDAFAQADGDAAVLRAAIGLEQTIVVAYDYALSKGGLLDARARRFVRSFREQERQHATALTSALRAMGGTPPARPLSVRGLTGLRDQRGFLAFAIGLEEMGVAAYYDAHAKLRSAALMKTGTSIMADEGQHLVVLRTAAGRPAVPSAFETGRSAG
jgi:rubrerythrin